MSTSTSSINIYTESTPNPATMKFLVNKLLINNSLDFPTQESAENSPFAHELFKFNFVNGVFFASNFVTVTKVEGIEWPEIEAILKSRKKVKRKPPLLKAQKPKLKFNKFLTTM